MVAQILHILKCNATAQALKIVRLRFVQELSIFTIVSPVEIISSTITSLSLDKRLVKTIKITDNLEKFTSQVNELDKILTLSTCYNELEKVVLHAKLIKIEEK